MKINTKNKRAWKLLPLLSLFCIPAITGCNQDMVDEKESTETCVDTDTHPGITISVDGMDGYWDAATRSGVENDVENQELLDTRVDTVVQDGKNLLVRTELFSESYSDKVKTRAVLKNAVFWAVAYKGAPLYNAPYAGQALFQIDNSGAVSLVEGTASPSSKVFKNWMLEPGTYSFVLYSYGTETRPPTPSSSSYRVPLESANGLLYYKVENVNVAYDSDNRFVLKGVKFKQQGVKIDIDLKVNITGTNTNITECIGLVQNVPPKSLNWPIIDAPSSPGNSAWEFNFIKPVANTYKASVWLTLFPLTYGSNIVISIDKLRLENNPTIYKDIIIDRSYRDFQPGTHYHYNVTVLSENDLYTDGQIWAKGNLVRDGDKIRFANAGEQGSWFGWNSKTDDANPSTNYDRAKDPCSVVDGYNAYTWRTPTGEDVIRYYDVYSSQYGYRTFRKTVDGLDGIEIYNMWYSDRKLFLPTHGYVMWNPGYGYQYFDGDNGHYWLAQSWNDSGSTFLVQMNNVKAGMLDKHYEAQVRCIKNQN